MKKTLLVFLLVALFSLVMATGVFAAETPEYKVIDGKEFVFANGTPITIEDRAEGAEGASITWTGCTDPIEVGTGASVFGGMHNNATEVETSVTINGGYVKAVFGGGLHKSNTKNASVVMNKGRVAQINGGGASSWTTKCDCTSENQVWYDGDYEDAPCQTQKAYVEINGGTICGASFGLVYGGGCGYSNTENTTVIVNEGDLSAAYVTAGGSNGNTTTAMVYIEGGTVGMVQSVNRGTMEETSLVVVGGIVEKLYAAGENADDITGTISESVFVEVSGEAKVESLESGKNAGVLVDTATDTVVSAENIVVVPGTVEDAVDVEFTEKYQVQIDGYITLVEPNTTIKDLPEYEALTEKEGYKFIGFKTIDGKEFAEDTKIVENIHVETVFEKIEDNTGEGTKEEVKDEEPKMGIETSIITIFGVVAVVALAGYVVSKKK